MNSVLLNDSLVQSQPAPSGAPREMLGTNQDASEAYALLASQHSSVQVANEMSNMKTGMKSAHASQGGGGYGYGAPGPGPGIAQASPPTSAPFKSAGSQFMSAIVEYSFDKKGRESSRKGKEN